jgi:hypothetical protein
MDHPFSPAETVQFHRTYLGPAVAAFARLDEKGRQLLTSEMEELYCASNLGDGDNTVVRAEYLELRVRKE